MIDWMALNGINLPLGGFVGQEIVWSQGMPPQRAARKPHHSCLFASSSKRPLLNLVVPSLRVSRLILHSIF